MATLLNPFIRGLDANGDPVSGAQLAVFEAGTTTPVTTYSDRALSTAQAQPLIANSAGEFEQSFVAAGNYKIRVSDADGVTLNENDNVRIADRPDDPLFFDTRSDVLASTETYAEGTQITVINDGSNYLYVAAASGATDHDATNAGGQKLYYRRRFYETVAQLIASTEASRGEGKIWHAGGFSYEEVTTGEHLTTAGGVKLRVIPGDAGYNLVAFGAAGDGVTDDTTAIQRAFDVAGEAAIFGAGLTYVASSPLTITVDGFNIQNVVVSYTGSSASAALTIATGGDTYLTGSLKDFSLVSDGSGALIGIRTRKALRQTWSGVAVRGFDTTNAIGCTLEGSTSNRFFSCSFVSNYIGAKTLNFINTSGGAYVPANENKFFGCDFFGNSSDGFQMLGDAAAGGIQSTGNANGFHACWFEDNGGISLNIENSGDTTIDDCRFESGTGYNVSFAPTMGATIRRHTRILNCNFTGLSSPTAHLLVGSNAFGAQVIGNKFSGGGVTAWVDNGTSTKFLENNSDGTVDFDNETSNFANLTADSSTFGDSTIDQLTLTSRANGNNWTSVTVTSNEITYTATLSVCQTNSTTISTINGGNNGDVLMIKGNTSSGTATTLVSGGNIRLPSATTPALTFFSVATLVNDGSGRWLLVSYSDNA